MRTFAGKLLLLSLIAVLFSSCFERKEIILPQSASQSPQQLLDDVNQREVNEIGKDAAQFENDIVDETSEEVGGTTAPAVTPQEGTEGSTGTEVSTAPAATTPSSAVTTQTGSQVVKARMKYYVRDIEFNDSEISNDTTTLGNIIEFLGRSFAKMIMALGGSFDLELDPIRIPIPEEIPLDTIIGLKITRIRIDGAKDNDMKWLKSLSISLTSDEIENKIKEKIRTENNTTKTEEEMSNREMRQVAKELKKQRKLILSYAAKNNDCNFKCVEVDIIGENLIQFATENTREVIIYPTIQIGNAPKEHLSVNGFIEVEVTTKLDL